MRSEKRMKLFFVLFTILLLSVLIRNRIMLEDLLVDKYSILLGHWLLLNISLIFICVYIYLSAYDYIFEDFGIRYKWGTCVKKSISYKGIEIMFIRTAVTTARTQSFPVKDKNKKIVGAISFYLSEIDFTSSYNSYLECNMWGAKLKKFFPNCNEEMNVFLNDCDLKMLVEKTEARIYIAYNIYDLYKTELDSALSGYESRVYLILPKRDEKYNNIPYNRIYQNK